MIRLRNLVKRTIGFTMSALLTVSMMPAIVFAVPREGDNWDVEEDGGIWVGAYGEDVSINKGDTDYTWAYVGSDDGFTGELTVGNINCNEDRDAVEATSDSEDSNSIIVAGKVTAADWDGIYSEDNVGNIDITTGDIEAGDDGIDIWNNSGTAIVNTGSIKADDDGIYSEDNVGNIDITTGDIEAGDDGIDISCNYGTATINTGSIKADDDGVTIDAYDKGTTVVTVDGSIESGWFGVSEYVNGSGYASTSVNGNVTADVAGLYVDAYEDGQADITVLGDVKGSGGIEIDNSEGGSVNIVVDGNVTGRDEEYSEGVGIVVINQRPVFLMDASEGDGEPDKDSLPGKVNVLVTGTVAGDAENGVGVFTVDDGSNFKLTAWKIEQTTEDSPVGPGVVAAKLNPDVNLENPDVNLENPYVENEEFEKSIQYIVKIDPSEVAGVSSLGATKEDGSALDKEGDYEWAHEGDTVLLKVELQEGYELTNAYGQENQSYPFTKDESGNYYITVPRGGGIFISVETALKPVDPDDPVDPDQPVNPVVNVEVVDDESSSNNSSNNNGNPNFCATVARMIANAAYGANVEVMTITETGLDRTVIDALRARPDVSLTITFMINGVMYRVTIPAGADLSSLLDAAGGINFVSLAAYFNATPV